MHALDIYLAKKCPSLSLLIFGRYNDSWQWNSEVVFQSCSVRPGTSFNGVSGISCRRILRGLIISVFFSHSPNADSIWLAVPLYLIAPQSLPKWLMSPVNCPPSHPRLVRHCCCVVLLIASPATWLALRDAVTYWSCGHIECPPGDNKIKGSLWHL